MNRIRFILFLPLLLYFSQLSAQPGEKRIQYPRALKNAYFGLSIGAINYDFSAAQLEPGFTVSSVKTPPSLPGLFCMVTGLINFFPHRLLICAR